MLFISRFSWVGALLCLGLLAHNLAFAAPPKKGRMKFERNPSIAVNRNGKPVMGGRFPLGIERTTEGVVLTIRSAEAEDGTPTKTEGKYLAYSLEKDQEPNLRIATKIDRGCYWNIVHGGSNKNEFESGIEDVFYFTSQEGAHAGLYLAYIEHDRTNDLTLLERNKISNTERTFLVRKVVVYDNLNDGR